MPFIIKTKTGQTLYLKSDGSGYQSSKARNAARKAAA